MDVRLIDSMGNDSSIVQAARVSYGNGTKTPSEDRQLIRYLMRNWHTTPFEMVEFKFHVKVPIFVARQWLRHRTASVNEVSARYSIVDDEYWLPDVYRTQSKTNKQCSDTETDDVSAHMSQDLSCKTAFSVYNGLVDRGISRELARIHLPQSTFTEFYWKIDLHNLFHFLRLRIHEHAQQEIRVCAQKIFDLIKPIVPEACQAFTDYRLNAITFTGPEIMYIQSGNDSSLSIREIRECISKCRQLGLSFTQRTTADTSS
jgi:thymidylate synthase (FAD)